MLISIHQPAYLPWLGYFEKISRSDTFVFLDTVQYEKNSFVNRNLIKSPHGAVWLTVPVKVKGHIDSTILNTHIDEVREWRSRHIKTIEYNYRKAPNYRQLAPLVRDLIAYDTSSLPDYLFNHLLLWCDFLGLKKRIVRSSSLQLSSSKSRLVLDICRALGATKYLSGINGRNYLAESEFSDAGIGIEYQGFCSPHYNQLWGAFIPNLSALDYHMNFTNPAPLNN